MLEENNQNISELACVESNATQAALVPVDLKEESKALVERIIAETDEQKSKDLLQLFNTNQNKKTVARVNKLSDLLDTITDQALARFTSRPDEISNKELFDGLKVVQDLIERGQKQTAGTGEVPLIQVNQQTNEVNIGSNSGTLSRDSRERVKTAVLGLLNGILSDQQTTQANDTIVAEATEEEVGENNGE